MAHTGSYSGESGGLSSTAMQSHTSQTHDPRQDRSHLSTGPVPGCRRTTALHPCEAPTMLSRGNLLSFILGVAPHAVELAA